MLRDSNCLNSRQAIALLAKNRAASQIQMCYGTTPQWASSSTFCIPSGSNVMLVCTESRICQGIDLCAVNGQGRRGVADPLLAAGQKGKIMFPNTFL